MPKLLIDRNMKPYKLNGNCRMDRIHKAEIMLNGDADDKALLSVVDPDRSSIQRYAKAIKVSPDKIRVSHSF
jgi:hypothetical protein